MDHMKDKRPNKHQTYTPVIEQIINNDLFFIFLFSTQWDAI